MNRMVWTLVMLGGLLLASPAYAQEAPVEVVAQQGPLVVAQAEPEAGLVNGAFSLVLQGQVPEDYSFYAEANVGNGGEVICTTDDEMVGLGYPECAGNGSVNEVPFVAPEGQEIEYRVLGSQGSGLSQEVVTEGTTVAAEGMRIEASYAFTGGPMEDHTENPIQDPEWEPDVDGEQYGGVSSGVAEGAEPEDTVQVEEVEVAVIPAEEAAENVDPGSIADIATGGTGLLPDTGGLALVPLAGAALLLAAFFVRRLLP